MNVRGYELNGEWKVSNIGHTAQGKKGGKLYFLKRYGEYKLPRHDASTSAALYDRLKREFDSFKDNRIAINNALSSLAGPGGNIILPTDWFVDDIFYIEATEFVENLIEDDAILRLPKENKLFIMLTAAGALHNIHRKNIVHSDLKRTNILAARNAAGNTVAKIIDFDRSYFADKIRPDELGGDQSFMSPELMQCFMYDMADEALAYLSTKSDIFSLGLVFHDYLANGDHPKITGLTGSLKTRADEGKTVYSGEAILSGGKLVISDKITDKYLKRLIAAMLQPEPEDRPTAQEVLEVLKNKTVLDLKADSVILISGDSGEGSAAAASTSSRSSSASSAARSTASTSTASAEASTVDKTAIGFCAPWADHKIKLDEDKLKASGYVSCEQFVRGGTKCYQLYKRDGSARVFAVENLVILGFASRTGASAASTSAARSSSASSGSPSPSTAKTSADSEYTVYEDGTLWDSESAYRFDTDSVKRSGYKSVAKAERKGIKGYVLIKPSGEYRFMAVGALKMLGFIVNK